MGFLSKFWKALWTNPNSPKADQLREEWGLDEGETITITLEEPGDPGSLEYHTSRLRDLIDADIPRVMILSQRDGDVCEACAKADGKSYSTKYALRTKILPHKDCTNDACRCDYLGELYD